MLRIKLTRYMLNDVHQRYLLLHLLGVAHLLNAEPAIDIFHIHLNRVNLFHRELLPQLAIGLYRNRFCPVLVIHLHPQRNHRRKNAFLDSGHGVRGREQINGVLGGNFGLGWLGLFKPLRDHRRVDAKCLHDRGFLGLNDAFGVLPKLRIFQHLRAVRVALPHSTIGLHHRIIARIAERISQHDRQHCSIARVGALIRNVIDAVLQRGNAVVYWRVAFETTVKFPKWMPNNGKPIAPKRIAMAM